MVNLWASWASLISWASWASLTSWASWASWASLISCGLNIFNLFIYIE